MAQEPPAPRPQLAYLDHAYAVVDAVTADAIAACDYLRGFGRFVVGTTSADGKTWTGRYLFGRRTYVELFGPGDLAGPEGAEGSTGLGLSTRSRGELGMLAARIGADTTVELGRTTRREGDRDVAWFDHLSGSGTSSGLEVWVMEFLEEPNDLAVRDAAFETWTEEKAKSPTERGTPSLGEICSVELGASADDIAAAEPLLEAAGFVVTRTGDTWSANDEHTTITLNGGAADAAGMRRIEFELDSPAPAVHVETIGRSRLTIGPGSRGVWDFGGPAAAV